MVCAGLHDTLQCFSLSWTSQPVKDVTGRGDWQCRAACKSTGAAGPASLCSFKRQQLKLQVGHACDDGCTACVGTHRQTVGVRFRCWTQQLCSQQRQPCCTYSAAGRRRLALCSSAACCCCLLMMGGYNKGLTCSITAATRMAAHQLNFSNTSWGADWPTLRVMQYIPRASGNTQRGAWGSFKLLQWTTTTHTHIHLAHTHSHKSSPPPHSSAQCQAAKHRLQHRHC